MIVDDTDAIARRLAELRARDQQHVLAELVEAFERWAAEVRRSERRRLRMPRPRGGAE